MRNSGIFWLWFWGLIFPLTAHAQTAGGGWAAEWKKQPELNDVASVPYRKEIEKLLERKNFAEALPVAKRWHAAEKNSDEAAGHLGMLLQETGDLAGADDLYTTFLAKKDLKPLVRATILNSRGEVRFKQGRVAEAEADYAAAAKLQSSTSFADYEWAFTSSPLSRAARDDYSFRFTRSSTENSVKADLLQQLADRHAAMGNFLMAIMAEKEAIRFFPAQKRRGGDRRLKLFAQRLSAK